MDAVVAGVDDLVARLRQRRFGAGRRAAGGRVRRHRALARDRAGGDAAGDDPAVLDGRRGPRLRRDVPEQVRAAAVPAPDHDRGARSVPVVLRRVEDAVRLQDGAQVDDGRADPVAERALPQRGRRRRRRRHAPAVALRGRDRAGLHVHRHDADGRDADDGGQREPGRHGRAREEHARDRRGQADAPPLLRAVPGLREHLVGPEAQHRGVRVGQRRHGQGDAHVHRPDRVPEAGAASSSC